MAKCNYCKTDKFGLFNEVMSKKIKINGVYQAFISLYMEDIDNKVYFYQELGYKEVGEPIVTHKKQIKYCPFCGRKF